MKRMKLALKSHENNHEHWQFFSDQRTKMVAFRFLQVITTVLMFLCQLLLSDNYREAETTFKK